MNELINKLKIYGWRKSLIYAFIDIKDIFLMRLMKDSYSQKGEDLIMDNLLEQPKNGFYVDVGANDPDRFSNTKKFYRRGWSGINIEPNKENYSKFLKKRGRDINLNIGVGNKKSYLLFYKFIPDALSTFSRNVSEGYKRQGYLFLGTSKVKVDTLSNIFSKYCNKRIIDILSIDVEGFDLKVLEGNDWTTFRPKLICIESVDHDIVDTNREDRQDIHEFLLSKGYEKKYNNNLNTIYMRKYLLKPKKKINSLNRNE